MESTVHSLQVLHDAYAKSSRRTPARSDSKTPERVLRDAQYMETMGLVACGLVHDFKNALTVMMGQTELLRIDGGDDLRERSDRILKAGQRATALANTLLEIARKEPEGRQESADPAIIINESLKLLGSLESTQSQFHATSIKKGMQVALSSIKIHQVIFNLCLNANYASAPGARIEISLVPDKPSDAWAYAVLTVRDNGSGMSNAVRERVFDPFYTTRGNGTGLGLTMVRSILEEAGGDIKIDSVPGVGTTATVRFPRANEGNGSQPEPMTGLHTNLRSAVVLDCNSSTREVLKDLFTAAGVHCTTFQHPEDLYSHMQDSTPVPDELLIDESVGLNRLVKTSEWIRQQHPSIKISGLTAGSKEALTEIIPPYALDTIIEKTALVRQLANACARPPVS